MLYSEMSTYN